MKTLIFIVMQMTSALAWATDTRIIGNGGGGVNRNGVYMTFGSAGFFVDPQPPEAIPSLDLVLQTIDDFGIAEIDRANFKQAVLPIGARKYYNVLKSKLDPETYKKLQEEYGKIVAQPPESIVLFAVTDLKTRVTYLLPEFYNLKDSEKAAILFHEAYWILAPKADYLDVVQAEVSFQRYVEAKQSGMYDRGLGLALAKIYDDQGAYLRMDYQADIKSGALKSGRDGVLLRGAIPFPEKWEGDNSSSSLKSSEGGPVLTVKAYELLKANPKSQFLRAVADFLAPNNSGRAGSLQINLKLKAPWDFSDPKNRNLIIQSIETEIDKTYNFRTLKVTVVER